MSNAEDSGAPGSAPGSVLGMLAAMRSLGLDVDAIGAAMGFSEASLAGRTEYLPVADVVTMWRAALKQFGRGTLGLYVGAAIPVGSLLDYLASASPSLRAALGQIARYIALDSSAVRWALGPRDQDDLTMFEEELTFEPAGVPLE